MELATRIGQGTTTANTPEHDPFAKVIAKAWADEAYKQRLVDDPRTALTEAGLAPPEHVKIQVVENTDSVVHLVIPQAPVEDEISEEALSQVNGGDSFCAITAASWGPPW